MGDKKLYLDQGRRSKFNKKLLLLIPVIFIALYFIRGPYVAKKHQQIGDKQLAENNLSVALYEYKRALAADIFNKRVSFQIGEVYSRALKCADAERYYRRSKQVLGLGKASECQRELGELDRAQAILDENNSTELDFYRIRILLARGKTDDAIGKAEELYSRDKTSNSLTLLLISLALKDKSAAVTRYKQEKINSPIGDLFAKQFKARSKETQTLYLAQDLVSQSMPDIALPLVEKLVKTNKSYRDAYLVLAGIYHLLAQDSKAIEMAKNAIDLDPFSSSSYIFLSELYTGIGDHKNAEEAKNKAKDFNLGS